MIKPLFKLILIQHIVQLKNPGNAADYDMYFAPGKKKPLVQQVAHKHRGVYKLSDTFHLTDGTYWHLHVSRIVQIVAQLSDKLRNFPTGVKSIQ